MPSGAMARTKKAYGTEKEGAIPGRPFGDLEAQLNAKLVGQSDAVAKIIPYIEMYRAGLNPRSRPAGIFMLLGPTGTGKSLTIEALAEVLHGDSKSFLRINCGEYTQDHEVAKLIGAPPGYLGHRETTPALTQLKLAGVSSDRCSLALVLLDEIEKASPAFQRIFLSVLDKGELRLGDGSVVNFEKTLVFMTSNAGGREITDGITGRGMGLPMPGVPLKFESSGLAALRRKFSPEFHNRIDEIVTYRTLGRAEMSRILDLEWDKLQRLINDRRSDKPYGGFPIEMEESVAEYLLDKGTSPQYGARELKRLIHRECVMAITRLVRESEPAGAIVVVKLNGNGLVAEVEK